MQFTTPVALPSAAPVLTPESHVLLLGSCFADAVGQRLSTAMPADHVCPNPFGVLYNPASIATAVEMAHSDSLPAAACFAGSDGWWHSWFHASTASAESREACQQKAEAALHSAAEALRSADMLIVTFGTTHTYTHQQHGFTVANCHKEVPTTFRQDEMSISDIVSIWEPLWTMLHKHYPRLHLVFTVSPYRYKAYGLHASQLAKATLLLATERLCALHPQIHYFPAYEILLDELRDYRYYADDLLHPSALAADYIFERFAQWAFSPTLTAFATERERLRRTEAHRPLHPGSTAAAKHQSTVEAQRQAFRAKWGTL